MGPIGPIGPMARRSSKSAGDVIFGLFLARLAEYFRRSIKFNQISEVKERRQI